MIEQIFMFTRGDARVTEPVVRDENLHYMHVILSRNDRLPVHESNAVTYMTVLRGMISIGLADQPMHNYCVGTVLKIPFGTKMDIQNTSEDTLEFTIVKAPAPKD